jgi:hypothetical protein
MNATRLAKMRHLLGTYDQIVTPRVAGRALSRPLLYRTLYFATEKAARAWDAPKWWRLTTPVREVDRRVKVRGRLVTRRVWTVGMMRVL